MKKVGTKRIAALIALPFITCVALTLILVFRRELVDVFSSSGGLRHWVATWGSVAPLVFVGVQAFQVIVFVVPGEVPQIVGGYLFGPWVGSLLSVAGITIGSCVGFWVARLLGLPFVESLFDREKIARVQRFASSPRSKRVMFLLFVIPGLPKDILCYAAGLSKIRFVVFILISMTGRMPGIIGSAMMGDAAAAKQWILAGVILGLALILFAAGFLFKDRIQALMEKYSRRPH